MLLLLARPFLNRSQRSSGRPCRGDARRRCRFGRGTRPPAVIGGALDVQSEDLRAIAVPACRSAIAALAVAVSTVLWFPVGGAAPAHAAHPSGTRHTVEAIVQFEPGTSRDAGVRIVRAAGGRVVRDL